MRLEVERAMRAGTALTLLVVELDEFAARRDDEGDDWAAAVLRHVGAVVRERCRITDEPARCGGDRIGVVLSGTTIDGAWLLADDIRGGIAGLGRGLTASAGLAQLGGEVDGREALVSAAEAALREAARCGDRTVGFLPTRAGPDRERPGS